MAEDPVFVQVYATLPKELYDKLDDDDLDNLRRFDVSIDDSKQRFDQPILRGKWKQLSEVKWNLQKKYFPLTINKLTKKRTRDTTDEANIARSKGNKGIASIIPLTGRLERTPKKRNVSKAKRNVLQTGARAFHGRSNTRCGKMTPRNKKLKVKKSLLTQKKQNKIVGSKEGYLTFNNGEMPTTKSESDYSNTFLKPGIDMMAHKRSNTCLDQRFPNSEESSPEHNALVSANREEPERPPRSNKSEYVNSEDDTKEEPSQQSIKFGFRSTNQKNEFSRQHKLFSNQSNVDQLGTLAIVSNSQDIITERFIPSCGSNQTDKNWMDDKINEMLNGFQFVSLNSQDKEPKAQMHEQSCPANYQNDSSQQVSQLKQGNTPQYENDDRQNVANYPAGTEVISVRKGSEAQSGNEDLPSSVSTNVDSPTNPTNGSNIPSYNQVPACSPPVTSNIPRQPPCTSAVECKIQIIKEPSAGHHQHTPNPVPELSITTTQEGSQDIRNKGHEISECNSALSADGNKEEHSNSEPTARREQCGLFHRSEEKGNELRNKGQDINHQEDVKEILTGNTPTVQRDEVPSTGGPADGTSSSLELGLENSSSGIFTTETAQKQQNTHQNHLWQVEPHDSNNLSNFSAAGTEPGTFVEQTLERDNELEANENPRDNTHNLEPESFDQKGHVLAIQDQGQLGVGMEKRDTFRLTPSPTPIGNKPVDMDTGDRETSQSMDFSEQIQYAHQGARPKTTHTQERTLYTGNLPTFITDKYLWLWYKHSNIDNHEETMQKYHCTMEEHLIDGGTKDLEIVVRSDRGGSEEGQLEVGQCMDDVTQTLVSIQSQHEIIEMPMPSSYTHHLGINTNLPAHTYVCDDLNKGTVIIGVNKVDVQSVYDWLNSEDNDSKGNKGAEHTNTTTNPGTGIYSNSNNKKHATDDENTGDGNQDTGVKEKAVKMDYNLFRYIGKFHKTDLTNIKEKYNVKVKADTLENGHGVRLQGFDLNVRGAYEEITRFIVELNEIVRSDTIEVSPASYSELEITEIIDCLKHKYDGILLEHRQNTIFLIGDQELLSQAKHELQSKLSGIQKSIIAHPSGKNVDQYPPSSRKRNRQIMQPLVTQSNTIGYTYSTQNGRKIHIFKGDITKLLVGAVVNASNTNLRHGGGVAGAISKAAGPQLQAECSHYVKQMGTLHTSNGYISSAYNMPCQYIIHVAGPRWSDYSDKKMAEAYLTASFQNVLAEADRLKLRSIAIPAVGSGIFGAPLDIVAQTMFDAVSQFVEGSVAGSELRDIILVDINAEILELLVLHHEQAASKKLIQSTPADYERFIGSPGRASAVKAEVVGHRNSNKEEDSQMYEATPNSSHRDSSSWPSNISKRKCVPLQESGYKSFAEATRSAVTIEANPTQNNSRPSQESIQLPLPIKPSDPQMPSDKEETCAICMETPTNKVELPICKHLFCKECIDTWFQNKRICPTCGHIHGALKGDQPNGTMTSYRLRDHLPGYNRCRGTIVINYKFPAGQQQDFHPNPGRMYHSTSRTAYLPDTIEGSRVLGLLKRAFDAKLTFTIGWSTTTGQEDQITWNDIHHKTNMKGGPARFGYPDANYLNRVKEELAAKGIK